MALKAKLILAAKIAAVFLIVPFLLGRLSVIVLDLAYPPPAPRVERQAAPTPAGNRPLTMKERIEELEEKSAVASEGLMSVRAKTRATLIIVGIYYVLAIAAWIILWRRKRSRTQPQQTE